MTSAIGSECALRESKPSKGEVILSKNNPHWDTVQHNFGNVGGKQLVGSFKGGAVSDLGGMAPLGQLLQKNSIIADFSKRIPDWRVGGGKYSIVHLVTQRVALICAGFEDAIDSNYKRNDPCVRMLLAMLTGRGVVASQGTISLLEGKIDRRTCFALGRWYIESYGDSLKERGVKDVVLDFDGSHSTVRGNQQGGAYNGHYGVRMYRPMFVHDQFGSLVIPLLRRGNAAEQDFVLALLKRIVACLRRKIPDIKITIRGDAGLNDPKIYDWCDDNGVYYIFRLKGNGPQGSLFNESEPAARAVDKRFRKEFGRPRYMHSQISRTKLENAIRKLPKAKRKKKLAELEKRIRRVFAEFHYEAGKGGNDKRKWTRPRTVFAVATCTDWGVERTFFVTNIKDRNGETLIRELYNQRGNMERWIGEMKGLDCTRLSCQEFESNQFRLFLHGLAYRLMCLLRRLLPKAIRNWSLASIRKYFMRMPAIFVENNRQFSLKWTSLFDRKKEFHLLCRAIDRLPPLRC